VARFIAKRLAVSIPVLFGITVVVFVIMRLVPGDPVRIMYGDQTSPRRDILAPPLIW
jgi:ABC-type dipeptide/oligopeptide/nickel transport system permease component